jgi:hypothetical protein
MTVLAPMREEVFAQFAERSIADYAEENNRLWTLARRRSARTVES